MSDTILSGDFTVHYDESQTGGRDRRQIIWTGGTNAARTVNELYSALQDLFDDSAQMDDRVPMTAQTPTDYTMVNGWFIDDTSVENLTGGTIQTSGWAVNEIVEVEYTDVSALLTADIGDEITTATDGGTLLDFNDTTATQHLWIRPDIPGTDDFATAELFTMTSSARTGNIVVTTNATGEAIWANPITIASLADNTLVYVYQNIDDTTTAGSDNKTRVIATKGTDSWWGEGNVDFLLKVQNVGTLIDEGYATFFARQYTQLYSHSVVDLSAGARTPIALETQNDLNNDEGFRQLLTNAETGGGWTSADVGSRIEEDTATPTAEGVLTSVSGTGPNYTMQYYLVGNVSNDFVTTDVFTPVPDDGRDATVNGAPTNVNPLAAPDSTITVTHANTLKDLSNGNGSQPYSIVVDAQATPINDTYERLKYVTRRGETGTGSTDGIAGEEYIGNELHLNYSSLTGAFVEGEQLWCFNSGDTILVATGIVVADHGAANDGGLQLRNVRTYTSDTIGLVGDSSTSHAASSDKATVDTPRSLAPVKASPFGTFAGGVFFGAPGVWIEDLFSGDEQAFQLTDDLGVVQTPPNTVSITVTNLISGDSVAVFRRLTSTAGSNVDKDEFASVATNNALGDSTFEVSTAPGGEVPTSGKIRVVDTGTQEEHRYRYSSIGTGPDAFILATASSGTADGGDADTLVDSGADFVTDAVEVGDLIYNTPETSYHRVTAVTDLNTLETEPFPGQAAIPSTWNGDAYSVNTLVQLYDTGDNVWVPIIDETATATTASNTLILEAAGGQDSDGSIHVRVVVRRNTATAILPFETDTTITSTAGLSQAAIRNPDTITS